jgi:hypothetical protein
MGTLVILGGGCFPVLPNDNLGPSSKADQSMAPLEQVSVAGWFHVIRNGKTRFMLIDDQGRWSEILLDEALARPLGGPRALNQKRVKIVGERSKVSPEIIRALSIKLD